MTKKYALCSVFIGLSVLLLTICLFYNFKSKSIIIEKQQFINPDIYQHSSSCIDCERQFMPQMQWKGQSSKCYSCEKDMERRCGAAATFNATKEKCFDC
jgi:hypothetical protein